VVVALFLFVVGEQGVVMGKGCCCCAACAGADGAAA
jgi:hypothetical protein